MSYQLPKGLCYISILLKVCYPTFNKVDYNKKVTFDNNKYT